MRKSLPEDEPKIIENSRTTQNALNLSEDDLLNLSRLSTCSDQSEESLHSASDTSLRTQRSFQPTRPVL